MAMPTLQLQPIPQTSSRRADLQLAARAAMEKTGKYALKTLWYSTVTITCPIWGPILGGCYAWDVHHNGRSRHGLNSEKWRYRQMQRHKRNRKVRARPLLLPRNALEVAEKSCKQPGTSDQKDCVLFSKLPPEVRALIWESVFEEVDIHARIQGIVRSWAPFDDDEKPELMVYPCMDHAYIAHPHSIDDTIQRYDTTDRALDAFRRDRDIYDLNCWPRRNQDVKMAWPKKKRKEIKKLGRVLEVCRTSRLVQLETLRALAKTTNVVSTWHWPNTVGPDKWIGEFLPFDNQRTISSMLYTKQRYEGWTAETNPLNLGGMYGPFIQNINRMKLVVVDFRWKCDERRDEVWEEWMHWLVHSMSEVSLRESRVLLGHETDVNPCRSKTTSASSKSS
ncbi:MAG: hypothetical protein Q9162_003678 [Coniocarpon cinnabarinum]